MLQNESHTFNSILIFREGNTEERCDTLFSEEQAFAFAGSKTLRTHWAHFTNDRDNDVLML